MGLFDINQNDKNYKGRTTSVDSKMILDSSIIDRLREAGYVLTLANITNDFVVKNYGQYIWPSTIGNVPAFKSAEGGIYLLTDRQEVFLVVTNVQTVSSGPDKVQDHANDTRVTGGPMPPGDDVKIVNNGGGGGVVVTGGGGVVTTGGGGVTNNPPPPPPPPPPVPGGLIGSGKIYTQFNSEDVVANQEEVITRAMWTNNVSNLVDFFIDSNQTASQLKYYIQVVNSDSETDCNYEPQFSIAFGNKYGSGSEDQGVQIDDTPTRAIYGQYRMLCLNGTQETFTINGKSVESIYAINVNRERYREWIDEGNLQINLQALTGYNYGKTSNNGFTGSAWNYTGSDIDVFGSKQIVSLIDDSRINSPMMTVSGEVYNIVSGSLENYAVNGGVYLSGSAPVYYGLLYKTMGIIVLDAEMLDDNLYFGTVIANSVGGGEINGDNNVRLFKSMSGSCDYTDDSGDALGFQARSAERVKSTHYFCRLKNAEYNFSNNPTYVIGSDGDLAHPSMINDPISYITTVGLYNSAKELIAIGKLSEPFQKKFNREAVVRVKIEY